MKKHLFQIIEVQEKYLTYPKLRFFSKTNRTWVSREFVAQTIQDKTQRVVIEKSPGLKIRLRKGDAGPIMKYAYLSLIKESEAFQRSKARESNDTAILNRVIRGGGFLTYIDKLEIKDMEVTNKRIMKNKKRHRCIECKNDVTSDTMMMAYTFSDGSKYIRKKVCLDCEKYFKRSDPKYDVPESIPDK